MRTDRPPFRAPSRDGASAWAPGRCTIAGEHVDYAAGVVLAVAIDLGVGVEVRPSADGRFRAESAGRHTERFDPAPVGDVGDRIFAAALALRQHGIEVPAVEARVVATLPEGAGLASSAAIVCATLVALLRLRHTRVAAGTLVALALTAERDIVGVPCGSMDQHVIVESRGSAALLLDCRSEKYTGVPWPWPDVVLCICDTRERHDVGGDAYRRRRAEAASVMRALGVESAQDINAELLRDRLGGEVELRRGRHLMSESRRSIAAARALTDRDAVALGEVMTASHRSLRDDYEVSTPALDRAIEAALRVRGCHGARLVGAGFGGSAVALVDAAAADDCLSAMAAAVGAGRGSGWVARPAAGLVADAADVISLG